MNGVRYRSQSSKPWPPQGLAPPGREGSGPKLLVYPRLATPPRKLERRQIYWFVQSTSEWELNSHGELKPLLIISSNAFFFLHCCYLLIFRESPEWRYPHSALASMWLHWTCTKKKSQFSYLSCCYDSSRHACSCQEHRADHPKSLPFTQYYIFRLPIAGYFSPRFLCGFAWNFISVKTWHDLARILTISCILLAWPFK